MSKILFSAALLLFSILSPLLSFAQNPKITKNAIIFTYSNPEAHSVRLLTSADGFVKFFTFQKIGEEWSLKLDTSSPDFQLTPGKYFYKLIVNNIHTLDPENELYETSPYYGRINYFEVKTPLMAFSQNPQKIGPLTYRFYFHASSGWKKVKEIMFVGTFNHWQPYELFLREHAENIWYIDYEFEEPGTYHYRYIINGEWTRDPANPHTGYNQLGETYSVVHATR